MLYRAIQDRRVFGRVASAVDALGGYLARLDRIVGYSRKILGFCGARFVRPGLLRSAPEIWNPIREDNQWQAVTKGTWN
jgi:hypothetical protein